MCCERSTPVGCRMCWLAISRANARLAKGDVKQQLVATAALDVESRQDLDEGSFKAAGKASCSRSDAVAAHAHRMHTVDLPPTMDQLGLTLTHHACTTSADGILLL